jgi:hypothetical protein
MPGGSACQDFRGVDWIELRETLHSKVLGSDILKTGNVVGCLNYPCRMTPVLLLRPWPDCDPFDRSNPSRVGTGPCASWSRGRHVAVVVGAVCSVRVSP